MTPDRRSSVLSVARSYVHRLRAVRLRGFQALHRRVGDAGRYWSDDSEVGWKANSHWRGGLSDPDWAQVGLDHLAMFDTFAKALDLPDHPATVIEWGCGGGANAVAFAPRCSHFIAADVSADSVAECVRQVGQVCDTPTTGLLIDINDAYAATVGRENTCDVFLCLYVVELTAGPEEALRILDAAQRVLVDGGLAMIQVKYHTTDRATRGHGRNYRRNLANMTTFAIDDFWIQAARHGLTPRLITLVPQNRLDVRYAYYALTKP